MRNAVQRRNHKERSQPKERQKWGLLEKHKDYSLRAADHNQKKRKIKALQQKASERNEDEFYFGMMSSTIVKGVKRAKRGEENSGGGGQSLSHEATQLMKTQDSAYLRTVLQSTRRDRQRLQEEVVAADTGVNVEAPVAGGKRLVFEEEDRNEVSRLVPDIGMADEESGSDSDSGRKTTTKVGDTALRRQKRHALEVKHRTLEALRDREEQLTAALRATDVQRARMTGGTGGVNKAGTKFKARARKR